MYVARTVAVIAEPILTRLGLTLRVRGLSHSGPGHDHCHRQYQKQADFFHASTSLKTERRIGRKNHQGDEFLFRVVQGQVSVVVVLGPQGHRGP